MSYFPFFIDIQDKNCIIAGGGIVSLRKVELLLKFGCKITVVSPEFCPEFDNFKNITKIQRKIQPSDIDTAFFVVAATNDTSVNTEISKLCHEKNIPVNVVDVKEECSFIFPSVYKNHEIVAGISTGGQSPFLAAKIRKNLENSIPEYYGSMAERLGSVRSFVKQNIPSEEKRKYAFKVILDRLVETENSITDNEIENIIRGIYENN